METKQNKTKVLVTGGNGFIGSNFIKKLLLEKNVEVINLDNETYAGRGENIKHMKLENHPSYKYYKADICDKKKIEKIFQEENPEVVVNFAAESHVDNSIENPLVFVNTNIIGTGNLLEASKNNKVKLFIQISTDEVYGSLTNDSPLSKESDILNPRSPYSSSKASAEQLAISYFYTFKLPVIVTRSSNNYGPYQHPEKLIPLFTTNLIDGKKVPLMYSEDNPGINIRDWIYVDDNCEAIWQLITNGVLGEVYNISGGNEKTNIQITKKILDNFSMGEEMIKKIPHRKGHDFRYAISDEKLSKVSQVKTKKDFESALKETVDWYKNNQSWWRPLKKKNGLIFGAGYMGHRISEELGYELSRVNILDVKEVEKILEERNPDVVINCAGKTGRPNVDWCEDNKEDTFMSNVSGAINLASLCSKKKIHMIHLGTGCIYSGDNNGRGFKEEDKSNHTNTYVVSKVAAENVLKELDVLQLRIRMPVDDRPIERNFIDKIKKYEKLIDDQNSVTVVPDLIKVIKKLIDIRATGIFNATNPGTISAAQTMQLYKEIVNPSHKFEIFSTAELDEITKAKRSNCILNTDKLKKLGLEMPEIHTSMRNCMLNYKKKLK